MFRVAAASQFVQLVAGARVAQHNTLASETNCPEVAGFYAQQGKCAPGGMEIKDFENGHPAYYGDDLAGGIHSVHEAGSVCFDHGDCKGFYTRDDTPGHYYSHYRSRIDSVDNSAQFSGYCCYRIEESYSLVDSSYGCPPVTGYFVSVGKCAPDGMHIEPNFEDGELSYYGQDANGGINSLNDAAHKCDQHSDCKGFYKKDNGWSHWRSYITHVLPMSDHCCYQKELPDWQH